MEWVIDSPISSGINDSNTSRYSSLIMEKITNIDVLLEKLDPDYKDVEQYTSLMNSLALTQQNIKDYCRWKDEFYARNLVRKTKAYELIVLCWQPRQQSPIHNHQGQDCWMYVVQGNMVEVQYHCQKNCETDSWKIKEGDHVLCSLGNTRYINDDICLHKLVNSTDEQAITLHLYSYPIETCNIYCCQTGKVTARKLSYSS